MAYLLLLLDIVDHALRGEHIFQDLVDLFAGSFKYLFDIFFAIVQRQHCRVI